MSILHLSKFLNDFFLPLIDARLGDAHDLARILHGSFDFIFCDADRVRQK
ncbi:MAG: hypothetical protein AB7Y74_09735 [Syntrophorhabdus sp.]